MSTERAVQPDPDDRADGADRHILTWLYTCRTNLLESNVSSGSYEACSNTDWRTANELGAAMLAYSRRSDDYDCATLDLAIKELRVALDNAPRDHPDIAVLTYNLALALCTRFSRSSGQDDFIEATRLLQTICTDLSMPSDAMELTELVTRALATLRSAYPDLAD